VRVILLAFDLDISPTFRGCVKLAPVYYEIVVVLRILGYSERKSSYNSF